MRFVCSSDTKLQNLAVVGGKKLLKRKRLGHRDGSGKVSMPKTIRSDLTVEVGDIVRVSLDPTIGQEQRKTGPCLIVEAGASPLELVITLPITDGRFRPESKTFVPLEGWKTFGLKKVSAVDCYQI